MSVESLLAEAHARDAELRRYRTLLLFGAPGAGKGTIGKALGAIPGFHHCACGDAFRNLDLTSHIGKIFLQYSSKGLLVPDDVTIALWKDSIDGHVMSHAFLPEQDRLVLDGIPRNVDQARIMADYIDVERIFYLVCTDEQAMMERLRRRALKENRLDDASEDVIRYRWKVYEAETQPVLEFYPREKITRIDAIDSPMKVLHAILGHLLETEVARAV